MSMFISETLGTRPEIKPCFQYSVITGRIIDLPVAICKFEKLDLTGIKW